MSAAPSATLPVWHSADWPDAPGRPPRAAERRIAFAPMTEADLDAMIGGDPRIRYLGYIERVEDIYETSDIIVVPSRKPEPLGLIALEAGACGKPVIATRVGGLPEIVEDGVTGYLVDPASPQALQEAILRLAGDAALRNRLGQSGRNQVTSQFTQQPIDAFQNLLLALANK